MISAVVTLISAILGSPLVLKLINQPGTQAATPTMELVISQNSLLPGVELFPATFTPTRCGFYNKKIHP
jgi:hypothetical protein